VKDLLEHIDKLKKQLAQLRPLSAENQQRLDKKFRLEWNFNSNHIEGNTLTYSETELLLIFDQTKGNHELREYEEMKGHDVALKLIYDLANDTERQLTEKFIREINEILLVRLFYKEAITPDGQPTRRQIKIGEYKSFPNSVLLQNGEIFHYPSPAETPAMMTDLMNWYQEASLNKNVQPVEVAAELHYKFVCIHPFDDGNGRIARLLMNYHLLKNDYPPVIIKTADKKNYLFALREADTGNITVFKNYIAEQLVWSYDISIKAGKGESIDEVGDWEKKIELLKKETIRKPEATKEKGIETTRDIFTNSIKPLIQELLSKSDGLKDFYQKSDLSLNFNNQISTSDNIQDLLFSTLSRFDKKIDSIAFSQNLINFKKNGTDTFDSYYNILFWFSDLTYSVTINNEKPEFIKKLNSEYLTKDEINSVVSFITEKIYDEIQQKIKR
jgi:Fic family protein